MRCWPKTSWSSRPRPLESVRPTEATSGHDRATPHRGFRPGTNQALGHPRHGRPPRAALGRTGGRRGLIPAGLRPDLRAVSGHPGTAQDRRSLRPADARSCARGRTPACAPKRADRNPGGGGRRLSRQCTCRQLGRLDTDPYDLRWSNLLPSRTPGRTCPVRAASAGRAGRWRGALALCRRLSDRRHPLWDRRRPGTALDLPGRQPPHSACGRRPADRHGDQARRN